MLIPRSIFLMNILLGSSLIFDVQNQYTTAVYQCIKSSNYTTISVRANKKDQGTSSFYIQSLYNAKNAGLDTQIFVLPCRNMTPAAQAKQIISQIPRDLYRRAWIKPTSDQRFDGACAWINYTTESNCQYLQDILNQFTNYNVSVGVQISYYGWKKYFGSTNACPLSEKIPLWWISWDNQPSFDSFSPFGNWTMPNRKQYTFDTFVCGVVGQISIGS